MIAPNTPPTPASLLPLIIDMDGTLLRTDVLMEGIAATAFSKPLRFARAGLALAKGRPAFKRAIASLAQLDLATLPAREDLLAYLHAQKRLGRRIELVTAADEAEARHVAARFDVFDAVHGTKGATNLKGARKAAFLHARHPDGFVYAGDSPADLPVWRAASAIILAGAEPATARAARALGRPIEAEFPDPPAGAAAWLDALGVRDWRLGLGIFAPLFFAGGWVDPRALMLCAAGFAALCAGGAGASLIAALGRLAADRRDDTLRHRPLASGALPVHEGLLAACGSTLAAGVGALVLSPASAVVLAAFFAASLIAAKSDKRGPLATSALTFARFALPVVMGAILVGALAG